MSLNLNVGVQGIIGGGFITGPNQTDTDKLLDSFCFAVRGQNGSTTLRNLGNRTYDIYRTYGIYWYAPATANSTVHTRAFRINGTQVADEVYNTAGNVDATLIQGQSWDVFQNVQITTAR